MLDWMDVTALSFNTLLLLERVQLSWLAGSPPDTAWGIALHANPVVAWYLRHKCPPLASWVDAALALPAASKPEEVRQAEIQIMRRLNDRLVYVVAPEQYDAQSFLRWDSQELTGLLDFSGKRVIDVGAGTGRLTFAVAAKAEAVLAVEPVARLRQYIRERAAALGLCNVYAVDGLITEIPLPPDFADVTMAGHVFGEYLDAEYQELARVTRPGGMIVLCPGNNDEDNANHAYLLAQGFAWSRFEEPRDGIKRKYWKHL